MSNILAGEWKLIKSMLAETDIIDYIVLHTTSPDNSIMEMAVWSLSNIVGDVEGKIVREKLISVSVVDNILNRMLTLDGTHKKILTTVVWFFSNILKGPPFPDPAYMNLYKRLVSFATN